jgi:hypothetical protein
MLLVSGCVSQNQSNTINSTKNNTIPDSSYQNIDYLNDVEKIEVLHFHGTHQCSSCIAVGDYAEETVNTYFADEVKNGKVIFAHINGDLPENSEMVTKYGVTGSSLWIGVYKNGSFSKEQNTNVWYKIGNKTEYMNYLKDIIEKRLNGEM